MDTPRELFTYLFKTIADPRVEDWPLMSEPWELFAIIATYLYGVFVFLPNYMAHKKPYSLKTIISIYNVYQVVACTLLIYGIATSGWTTDFSPFGCYNTDYSNNDRALRMTNFVWWHMIVKLSELLETVFFVLRKKFNQVSGLHVYHHVSTLIIAWIICKYFPGGMLTFTIMINSFIHILMYTYYFLSALGPDVQKKLEVVKPKLTALQLIQLITITLHTLQVFLPGCSVPNAAAYIYLPNMAINIYMFAQFYAKSYMKQKSS